MCGLPLTRNCTPKLDDHGIDNSEINSEFMLIMGSCESRKKQTIHTSVEAAVAAAVAAQFADCVLHLSEKSNCLFFLFELESQLILCFQLLKSMTRVMITFGSGGHTAEMSTLLRSARVSRKMADDEAGGYIKKLVCVISADDAFIQDKLIDEYFNSFDKFDTVRIRRPRDIKQSYLTTVWTFLLVLYQSFLIIREHKPNLYFTNGPGISVAFALAIRLMQIFDWNYKCHILYVESFCRTETLSLSAKVLYHLRLASEIYVQWPGLTKKYPRTKCEGILV